MIKIKYEANKIKGNWSSKPKDESSIAMVKYLSFSDSLCSLIFGFGFITYLALIVLSFIYNLFILIPIFSYLLVLLFDLSFTGKSIKKNKIHINEIHDNLKDEAGKLIIALNEVQLAKELYPEGIGITERSNQFGKLCFSLMDSMRKVEETSVGTNVNPIKHNIINEIGTKANNLHHSGMDLADMICNKRMNSILEDTKLLGVNEFIDSISTETMTYRSLNSAQ